MHQISPKLLIINSNPLSKQRNNGKTIVSLNIGWETDKVAQIYISEDEPSSNYSFT